MTAAKFNDCFGGWLAFRCGKVVMNRSHQIKVFRTEEQALAAAKKSNMGSGLR